MSISGYYGDDLAVCFPYYDKIDKNIYERYDHKKDKNKQKIFISIGLLYIKIDNHIRYKELIRKINKKYNIKINLRKLIPQIMDHCNYIHQLSNEDKMILGFKGTSDYENLDTRERFLPTYFINRKIGYNHINKRLIQIINQAPPFDYDYVFHGGKLDESGNFLSTSLSPLIALDYVNMHELSPYEKSVESPYFHVIKNINSKCLFISPIAAETKFELELLFVTQDGVDITEISPKEN